MILQDLLHQVFLGGRPVVWRKGLDKPGVLVSKKGLLLVLGVASPLPTAFHDAVDLFQCLDCFWKVEVEFALLVWVIFVE
jgi:hypothetical protein